MVMSKRLVGQIKHAFDDHNFKGERTNWYKIKDWLIEARYDIWHFWNDINPMHVVRRMIRHGILLKNFRISIKTLTPVWWDSDNQILHVNFQILTDFVEIECAHMATICEIEGYKELSKDKKKLGLFYLDRYINEPDEHDADNAWGNASQEIKELYLWWTVTRPTRVDPHDLITDRVEHELLMKFWVTPIKKRKQFHKDNPGFKKAYTAWGKECEKCRKVEEKYDLEDDNMLCRLIKVRKFLWT